MVSLTSLGEEHVGYRRLDFRALKFSVVGGRPFSCGGNRLFRPKLLSARLVQHKSIQHGGIYMFSNPVPLLDLRRIIVFCSEFLLSN